MAQRSYQTIIRKPDGLTPAWAAADALGDEFIAPTDERFFLAFRNTGGAAITVSVLKQFEGDGLMATTTRDYAIPAGSEKWIGPFPYPEYMAGGRCTYSSVSGLLVAVFYLPKP